MADPIAENIQAVKKLSAAERLELEKFLKLSTRPGTDPQTEQRLLLTSLSFAMRRAVRSC